MPAEYGTVRVGVTGFGAAAQNGLLILQQLCLDFLKFTGVADVSALAWQHCSDLGLHASNALFGHRIAGKTPRNLAM